MTDDIWDFGFTAMDEDELSTVQEAKTESQTTQERLDSLYNAIQPLLNNLKANSEKSYIYWPNRVEKIEQFEQTLLDIYQGK